MREQDYAVKADRPAQEDFSSELNRAKSGVVEVSNRLRGLVDAIRGPRPEPVDKNAGGIVGKRTLKEALEMTPGEISEMCIQSCKQIEEIRELLRL